MVQKKKRKAFLVDVDNNDPVFLLEVMDFISDLRKNNKMEEKIHTFLTTKNGYHIITSPFNLQEFRKKYIDIQVDNDASTLLYVNL